MKATTWLASVGAALLALLGSLPTDGPARAAMKPDAYWNVDDLRTGMKGVGRTVMKGTKVETFEAEVLGVLKNTSPGRDMVLCRLSGLNLDKTGVIAGMSGSPVYIDGKLLGAVAYAWPYGKEPIAGVTPFSQMHGYVEAFERRDLAEQTKPTRVGLQGPCASAASRSTPSPSRRSFDAAGQPEGRGRPVAGAAADAAGRHRLHAARPGPAARPRQGLRHGADAGRRRHGPRRRRGEERRPGAGRPARRRLITGDFDLSGIGTVTHIEGNRVYGWGHPFMSLGGCEFPLMTGYIHTIYPRQTVSFKMGSPLKAVGVINADVSTCIAGWLGRKPDMLPVTHDRQERLRRGGARPSTSRWPASAPCWPRWSTPP